MIVVDTNTILGVVLGRCFRPVFEIIQARRNLAAPVRAADEVLGVLRDLPGVREETTAQAETLLSRKRF